MMKVVLLKLDQHLHQLSTSTIGFGAISELLVSVHPRTCLFVAKQMEYMPWELECLFTSVL